MTEGQRSGNVANRTEIHSRCHWWGHPTLYRLLQLRSDRKSNTFTVRSSTFSHHYRFTRCLPLKRPDRVCVCECVCVRDKYEFGIRQTATLTLLTHSRDGVLEVSASARGGLGAVFLTGSASPRPLTVLSPSWLGLVFDILFLK